jgi:hypothetical protein
MNSVIYPILAAVSCMALFYRLRILRIDRSPANWALCSNFFLSAVIFTVSTPSVWVATSRFAGVVDFSGLFTQVLAMCLASSQQLILLHLTYERRIAWRKARLRLVVIGLVVTAMITLFVFAGNARELPTDYALTTARFYPAYLSIYVAAYLWNQIDVCVLCWRHARVSPTPWLRRGLRLVALTLPSSLVYGGCRAADIIAAQVGVSGKAWEPLVPFALLVGIVGKTIGWTLPDWGRHITTAREWFHHRVLYRQLTPLHRQITAHVPDSVLKLDPDDDLRTRLYRMVVEVRDAQWTLRLWMTPEEAASARSEGQALGLHGDDLLAFIEAQQLKAAVEAKVHGAEPEDRSIVPRLAEPPDLAAELSFQRKIARHFRATRQAPLIPAVAGSAPSTAPQEGNRA